LVILRKETLPFAHLWWWSSNNDSASAGGTRPKGVWKSAAHQLTKGTVTLAARNGVVLQRKLSLFEEAEYPQSRLVTLKASRAPGGHRRLGAEPLHVRKCREKA